MRTVICKKDIAQNNTIPSVIKLDKGRVAAKARAKTAGNTQQVRIIPTTAVMKQGNPIVFN